MKLKRKFFVINNVRYNVIESVTYKEKTYVYLVNSNDEFDSMFREVVNKNGKIELLEIESKFFSNKLSSIFREIILNS